MAVEHGGDAVSCAVDVDDFARLGNGVGGGHIDLRGRSLFTRLGGRLLPVPEDGVIGGKLLKKAEFLQRHAAAEADGPAGKLLRDGADGFLLCFENANRKSMICEILDCGIQLHNGSSNQVLSRAAIAASSSMACAWVMGLWGRGADWPKNVSQKLENSASEMGSSGRKRPVSCCRHPRSKACSMAAA